MLCVLGHKTKWIEKKQLSVVLFCVCSVWYIPFCIICNILWLKTSVLEASISFPPPSSLYLYVLHFFFLNQFWCLCDRWACVYKHIHSHTHYLPLNSTTQLNSALYFPVNTSIFKAKMFPRKRPAPLTDEQRAQMRAKYFNTCKAKPPDAPLTSQL